MRYYAGSAESFKDKTVVTKTTTSSSTRSINLLKTGVVAGLFRKTLTVLVVLMISHSLATKKTHKILGA